MPGLGKATSSRWVGWGTHQALGPEDFVRPKDMRQQRGCGVPGNLGQEREFQLWRFGENSLVICPR